MEETIKINNLKPFILKDNNLGYRIDKGKAFVFIGPFDDEGNAIERMFLKEVNVGDVVPGLNKEYEGKQYYLFFVNASRDEEGVFTELEISTAPTNDYEQYNFVKEEKKVIPYENYANDLIQGYLLERTKESKNIYSGYKANETALNSVINNAISAFNILNKYDYDLYHTTSDLYFTLAMVASATGIDYVKLNKLSYEEVRSLDIEKFCELSLCVNRKFLLDNNWIKDDLGPFVAYLKENHKPVPIIYKNNTYHYYPSRDSYPVPIDNTNWDIFEKEAFILYRPLPNKSLKIKDLTRFCLKSIPVFTLCAVAILSLFVSILGIVIPYFNKTLFDTFIPDEDAGGIIGLGIVFVLIIVVSGLFSFVRGFSFISILSKMKYSLQFALFDRIFKLKYTFLKTLSPADISACVLEGCEIFTSLLSESISSLLVLLTSIVYIVQMSLLLPELMLAAILILVTTILGQFILSLLQIKNQKDLFNIKIDKSSLLFQIIRGISKIRISGAEDRSVNKYMRDHIVYSKKNYIIGFFTSFQNLFSVVSSFMATLVFFILIINLDLTQSVGDIVGFLSAFSMFFVVINQLTRLFNQYVLASPMITRLEKIIKETPEVCEGADAYHNVEGNIDINHIKFSYSDRDNLILDDVSISIKKGEYVAIVGPSGCGKTTLFNLMLGFEKAISGNIFYDNCNLEELNKASLRKQFGVVLQDGEIISGTIFDNVTFMCPDASMEEAEDAIKLVGLYDEVKNMPMGMLTSLAEGSGLISGGQKQRILLARALITNPKIVFLDEATSSLDNITQNLIVENLEKIDATKIVIAHRLSTIIGCDRIYVLNEGKVVEQGTYEELWLKGGLFTELVKRQKL